jgi:hypothetical protein
VAIRAAYDDEQRMLNRLAALDSAASFHGDVLVGFIDGRCVAALARIHRSGR